MSCLTGNLIAPAPPRPPRDTKDWWSMLVMADPEVLERNDLGHKGLMYSNVVRQESDRHLAIVGDITRNGKEEQLDLALEAIEPWGIANCLLVRGNSELGVVGNRSQEYWEAKTTRPTQYHIDKPGARIIVADTSYVGTSDWEKHPSHENLGVITPWIDSAPQNVKKIVLTHVPVWRASTAVKLYRDMKEDERWKNVIAKCNVVVSGHLHYNDVDRFGGTWQFITVAPTGDHVVPTARGEIIRLWFKNDGSKFGVEYINLQATMSNHASDNQAETASYKPNIDIQCTGIQRGGFNKFKVNR